MKFNNVPRASRLLTGLIVLLTVAWTVSGLENQRNILPTREHNIAEINEQPVGRKLQAEKIEGFKMNFQLFIFSTANQDFEISPREAYPSIVQYFVKAALYFQEVLKVTDILTAADTIFPATAESPVPVPAEYTSTGFDVANAHSTIFLGFIDDQIAGLESYSYPIVVKRWPIYSYMRFNIAYMDSISSDSGKGFQRNMNKILRSFLNVLGWSPYYFYNFGHESIRPFYKSYTSTERLTTSQMIVKKVVDGKEQFFIITPSVKAQVQKHFQCNDQYLGALIENNPIAQDMLFKYGHAIILERDVFANEIMTISTTIPIIMPDSHKGHKISKIALALLRDTGFYYSVDATKAEKISFGKGAGCSFAQGIFYAHHHFIPYVPIVPIVPKVPDVSPPVTPPKQKLITIPYCAKYSQDYGAAQCTECAASYFLSKKKCVTCSDLIPYCNNCVDNYGKIQCAECVKSWFVSADKSTCWDCQSLVPYCKECVKSGLNIKCKTCDQATGWYVSTAGSCKVCTDLVPYCQKCDTNYGVTECEICASGYYSSSTTTCGSCSQKVPYCDSCEKVGSKVNCKVCSKGYSLNSDKKCVLCNEVFPYCAQCKDNSGTLECAKCSAGYLLNKGSCVTCNDIIPSCQTCVDNYGKIDCQKCTSGLTLQNNKCGSCSDSVPYCLKCSTQPGACQICDAENKYFLSKDNKCLTCSKAVNGCETCVAAVGGTQCSSCNVGFIYENTKSCIACSKAIPYCLECYETGTSVECDLCDDTLGYYQTKNSLCELCDKVIPFCNNCQDNYGVTECIDCAVGYYPSNDKSKCLKCALTIGNCAKCTKKGLVIQCNICNDGFEKVSNKCVRT